MSEAISVPHLGFEPRGYQLKLWNAVVKDGVKRAAVCWHRRAGKDLLALNIAMVKLLERPGLCWHLLPQFNQARRVVWNGMTSDGVPFLDYVHPELIERRRDDQMLIQFKKEYGGSIYQCVGSDQPDRLVGANPSLVIFSEFALADPACWDFIRPILNENEGAAIFISTPRGYNAFYDVMQAARESDKWFSEVLTVDDTRRPDGRPVVTEDQIEEDRRSGMPEELIRQEYYCDFSAPLTGAYFGKEMDAADKDGRVGAVPWMKGIPVYTAWDLGVSDATAIWFAQVVDGWVNWIDYYAASGAGLDHYIKMLQSKPYVYKQHWAPHDIRVRELGTGVSRWKTAADLGVVFQVVPRGSVDERINAARLVIPRSRFDKEKCAEGIKALRHFRKEWDTKNRLWGARPVHDWTSHGADSFSYGCMMMPQTGARVRTPVKWPGDETWDELMAENDRVRRDQRVNESLIWKGI
jgi:hypothetical protein